MTQPTNHHITVSLPDGKTARGKVVYLQPKAERWRERSALVHIICTEWIEPYWHTAVYVAGDRRYHGQFMPSTYKSNEDNTYFFAGTFERDE